MWNELAHVFVARRWSGEPVETPEIRPIWFPLEEIPYEEMCDDHRCWLGRALEGRSITARFIYSPDNETVDRVESEVG